MPQLPFPPTRIMFFTGKGGVGKTSLACATAVSLADADRRVLLVSTDPASNLDEVLGVQLSLRPAAVPGVRGLFALNIDPDAAAREYRERVVGPYRTMLPEATVARMEEQLSGACTVEIAAFDQFTTLLGDSTTTAEFDHVIFDTAPTGHTLRLLKLPAAWTGFIDTNSTGTSCLGPLAGLQGQLALYRASLAALANPAQTTIVLVSRPEPSALAEAARTSAELAALGVAHQRLIVNGVFTASSNDPIARSLERRGRDALTGLPPELAALARAEVPLLARAPMGIDGLRAVFGRAPSGREEQHASGSARSPLPGPLASLVDDIERDGRGVVLTMGKGGVGKTTSAAAIAVDLAARGHDVLLSTTDPAAHVASTIGGAAPPHLRLGRIDPAAEIRKYTREVLAAAAPALDARGRDLLEEDLRSPCTEEIAVFRAFAQSVAEGEERFVILDTAPTGHTLLLLDAAEAYHRDVSRTEGSAPDAVRRLLPRLRDPRFTKVLLVTVPEATPVHEAAQLQADLRRAGIEPFAWIVNQSFAGDDVRDPVLRERGTREDRYLAEVRDRLAARVVWIPWYADAPVGPERLLQLARRTEGVVVAQ